MKLSSVSWMGSLGSFLGSGELEIGETPLAGGGFRRVARLPAPRALADMRALLLEAAAGDGLAERGLAGFQEWRFIAALAAGAWGAGVRRSSVAGRRILRRRLRALGTAAMEVSAAASLIEGSSVHLRGGVRRMLPSRAESHIWVVGTTRADNVRLLVEEGHDFFIIPDGGGQVVCVIAARGHLINADRLAEGDRVSVFGTVARVADPRAESRSPRARGALALAVRASDDLPLLVRKEG